jgi:hypothetical protein
MTTLPPEVLANIAGKRLGIQQQHDTGLQQLGNQYNTNLYNLGEYEKDAGRRINDQYAAQGIFNSGIRVNEQGRMSKNVGERRGTLGQQYAMGQSGIENQYQNALQALEDYRTQATQEQTRQDLTQQQINAQNAATWQAAQASMGGAGGGAAPAPAGPTEEENLAIWNAEIQRQNENIWRWYAALAAQNPTKDEYAGYGNAIGNPGARFK